MPKERAAVTTPIGLPGAEGYKDGGPEIAKFHFPCGVAVNSDGTFVYYDPRYSKLFFLIVLTVTRQRYKRHDQYNQ